MHTGPEAGDRALNELVRRSRLAPAAELPGVVAAAARHLGAEDVVLHVVDHAQVALVPFGTGEEPVSIEGTIPGRAFRQVEVVAVDLGEGRVRLHVPLLDSVDRLGVLSATLPADHDGERFVTFCDVVAELLQGKADTGDTLVRAARLKPMSLAGEVQWALLPPLTVATEQVVIAAMLEPCYDVGGDVIDYSLDGGHAQFAIFDAMGHDLPAAVLVSVAVGAYRNARRAGGSLAEKAELIERTVGELFGEERLVTAVLANLHLDSGRLQWVNAGHPQPLLLRGGQVVKHLGGTPEPPLGMGLRGEAVVHEEVLEPGDRLLLYTDGVTEARDPDGTHFGLDRLVDMVVTAQASGEHAPETMRRLSRAVLEHQQGELQDDATHLLLEWRTSAPERLVI